MPKYYKRGKEAEEARARMLNLSEVDKQINILHDVLLGDYLEETENREKREKLWDKWTSGSEKEILKREQKFLEIHK